MSRLRALEEGRRRPKSMPWEERGKVLELLRGLLYERGEVLLAVVHGGFVSSNISCSITLPPHSGWQRSGGSCSSRKPVV
ncbi:MAG: hypothetical protein QXT37_05990 [Thermofilaceae archaeon]